MAWNVSLESTLKVNHSLQQGLSSQEIRSESVHQAQGAAERLLTVVHERQQQVSAEVNRVLEGLRECEATSAAAVQLGTLQKYARELSECKSSISESIAEANESLTAHELERDAAIAKIKKYIQTIKSRPCQSNNIDEMNKAGENLCKWIGKTK